MRYTLLAQIGLIGISIAIVFAFIRPMFAEIKVTQDQIFQYKDTVNKASEFNAYLQSLLATRNSFSPSDRALLENFIPTQIDVVAIMKNIETIFALSEVPINTLSAEEAVAPVVDYSFEGEVAVEPPSTTHQDFKVTFEGTYQNIKDVLLLTESNATLLEIVEMKLEPVTEEDEDGKKTVVVTGESQYRVEITFRAYALTTSL